MDFTFSILFYHLIEYSIGVLIATIAANALWQQIPRKKSEPPLVFHLIPFIGNAVSYGIDPVQFYEACREKHGDIFTFILFGRKMTVCLGTEGNELILNGKLQDVNAEEIYSPLTTPVFGKDIIYDCPNSKLMEQKKFVKFGLTQAALESYVPLIEQEVSNYLKSELTGTSGRLNVSTAMSEITLFTASRALQGAEVRKKLSAEFAEYYHDLDMGFQPINFLVPWAPLPHNRRRDAAREKMCAVYMDIIKGRRTAQAAGKDQSEHDMISHLLSCVYKNGRPVPDQEVVDMMITLLMGGQHSSSSASAWIMLRLASRPDILEEVYQEQRQHLGAEASGPLEYADLEKLPLLNNVVKETLRVHSSIHSIMRKVKNPIPVPGTDYVVTTDKVLVASPIMAHLNQRYFPNADAWDPHRWDSRPGAEEDEDEEGDMVDYGYGATNKGTRSPYLPFGAGRHRCIGEKFAYVNLVTIILTMVRKLKLSTLDGKSGVPPTDYSSLFSRPPLTTEICWELRDSE
ncbi:14-alpha sterol demethylase Cyp51A [Pestalotiopsis sp. NC0098]|nr:14-alpha sterol demethylase Cyp51A [Pestalotiopsis sp. NC0098]